MHGARKLTYTVTGLRAGRDFESGSWLIQPYLGINNIFNERYFSNIHSNAFGGRYYEPAPMRNVYVGIEVRYQPDTSQ